MTREEAISILRNTAWLGSYEMTGKVEEAINIVAEALKAQPNLQPTCNNLATDTIYRQDAIDVVKRLMGDYELSRTVQTGLHILPSAQPELHYDEWCTDCKEYDQERHCCPRWNRVIRETLKDAQAEEDCDTCKHGYFGDDQCNNCRVRYPSHYERRTDE